MRVLLKFVMPAAAAVALAIGCESRGPAADPVEEPAVEQPAVESSSVEAVPKPTAAELAEIEEAASEKKAAEKTRRDQIAAATDVELVSVTQRANYAIGYQFGRNLISQGVELHPDVMAKALADARSGESTLSPSEMQAAMMAFEQEMQGKMAAKGDENLKKSRAFLEANKQREGVQTTASGLQYEVIQEGDGATPTAEDTVQVHYRGTHIDGKEFDSSYSRGQPATFPVNGVISGWTEALQLMKEGGKLRIYLPPELGYGQRGAGGEIGPNEALVFDVELISVME